jgi:AraC-like DNA-binding protein
VARSTSLYFSERYFGTVLWGVNELKAVRELAETSRFGIRLIEPDNAEAARIISNIASEQGLRRVHAFFQLLTLITESKHALKLALQPGRLVQQEEERMNRILEFTFRESHRKIYLEEAAQQAHLSQEAFCRYFRLHTRKTYIGFLNEVRISQACQHLIRGESSVEDICNKVGFTNISNFNRIFKKITGKTPLKFRQQVWGFPHSPRDDKGGGIAIPLHIS